MPALGRGRAWPANTVTLGRAVLVAGCAIGTVRRDPPERAVFACGGMAYVLDAVDGQVARRWGRPTEFGARFDAETDAALLLVLSAATARRVGRSWPLMAGLARYAWWLMLRCRPALRGRQPRSELRRVAAGVGVGAYVVASAPALGRRGRLACAAAGTTAILASSARDLLAGERAQGRARQVR